MSKTNTLVPLLSALHDLAAWLKATQVEGLIIGGVAASILGRPRATRDVDALVLIDEKDWDGFLTVGSKFGFVARITNPLNFARKAKVLLVRHEPSGIDVDITFGSLPFEKEAITNAVWVTHATKREGIGVTLTDGRHECEASFHRYGKGSRYGEVFYIGSANRRLRSNDYTKKFRRFLEEVGTIDVGTFVKLEFEAYTIYISKV